MTFSIFLANLRLCLMKSHLILLLAHIRPNYNAFEQGLKFPHKTPKILHANFPMLLQSMDDGKSQKKFKDVWGTNRQCVTYVCILVPHFEENVHQVLL
jgi:hypothetical protein